MRWIQWLSDLSEYDLQASHRQSFEASGIRDPLLQGAVYVTDNGAYTWQAAVQETVDGTLNRTVSSGE